MRLLILLIFTLFAQSSFALEARVLIDENSISKELVGDMRLRCLKGFKKYPCPKKTYLLPSGRWKIERYKHRLRVTNLETKARSIIQGRYFQLTGSFMMDRKNMQRLDVYFKRHHTDWVAHFPVDQYLYGVMNSEVPRSWPAEALKAQAVASRTYFLFKKMERMKEHFDVRSDIMDQVFKMHAKRYNSIVNAVNATHGVILTSKKDGKVFPAYFHSDCGGKTSSERLVWRKPAAQNKSVKDPYCRTASKNNWSYGINRAKLMAIFQKYLHIPKGVKLVSILPRIKDHNRAHIVDILFSNNILKRIAANDLRKIVGFGRLRSTHFAVSETWNKVVFTGRGFGHGVGMCQWGAQRWARKGKDYRSILEHYYPQAQIKKLDTRSLQAQLVY